MAAVTDLEFAWAELIVEKRTIESDIDKLQQEIAGLGKEDPKIADLEAKLRDHRSALSSIVTKIDSNRTEYKNSMNALSSNTPNNDGKNEEQPHVHHTNDLFLNNLVTPSSHALNNSVSTPAHHTARIPKPPCYDKNDNFIRWMKRFKEHLLVSGHRDGTDISLYMLTYIRCESTWDRLQRLSLTVEEKCNIDLLIKRYTCLLYTSPSPRDTLLSRMPSSA